ncbi:MAG: methyltransferase domain-containing protein [Gemmatimonadota bacterium]
MNGYSTSAIGTEALDDPATDPALVVRMLGDIARANRWFGGTRTVHTGLEWLLEPGDRGRTLTLLDIGTGAGDLPLDAVRWARARGVTLRPLGIERIPAAAQLARRNGVPTLLACGTAQPVADRGVDIVLMSQLAHHLDDVGIVALFAECSRVARRGVIVADLRPSSMAEVAFRVGGAVLALHPMTVSDGITSLRRGFSTARLTRLLDQGTHRERCLVTQPIARVLACWRTDR